MLGVLDTLKQRINEETVGYTQWPTTLKQQKTEANVEFNRYFETTNTCNECGVYRYFETKNK